MVRKDLVFAAATGGVLSILACLLLTPHEKAQPVPARQAVAETQIKTRKVAPDVSPADGESLPVDVAPTPHKTRVPVVAVKRLSKPSRAFKAPEILPVEGAARQPIVLNPPDAQGASPLAEIPPIPQTLDAPASARTITPQEARVALAKVGTDSEAEAVWIAAINDPSLPANQRKDLIEDLNEEGFANPKKLTSEDLPRIEKRIALIEELAPEAIDQTNADAFQEAYKDLKNMQSRLNKP